MSKSTYKTKMIGHKRMMECKRGCGTYTMVSLATEAVVCTHCHTTELYDPATYILEYNKEDAEI